MTDERRRVVVTPPRGGRFIILPENNELQVPLYDENEQFLFIPQKDFDHLETAQEWAEYVVTTWSKKRETIVKELLGMAAELDGLKFKCNVSTTVGASVGIASGAAVIGGMILMPPLALAGLATGAVAATWNLGTGIFKLHQTKIRANKARILLEGDKDLMHSVKAAINALNIALEDVLKRQDNNNLPKGGSSSDNLAEAATMFGLAPNIVAIGARLALTESIAVSSNILKGAVHAAAGVGIALDLITVIINSRDLAMGSRCELAAKLREVAEQLETQRMELHREFINHVILDH